MWSADNSSKTQPGAVKQRFTDNLWVDIITDSLGVSYILPLRVYAHRYLVFLQEDLPEMLNDVFAHIRREM